MAKLNPPNIPGSLPSFYSGASGTVLSVPFSMNSTVSFSALENGKAMYARIKTAYTDVILKTDIPGAIRKVDSSTLYADFTLDSDVLSYLVLGDYYKVQLAYKSRDGVTGYYSTTAVIKYTAKPTTTIASLSRAATNINITKYIGVYYNPSEPTEIAYQYKFLLFDSSSNLVETSGWLLHNSYNDTSATSSTDSYMIETALEANKFYYIQYIVRTNSGLEIASSRYRVVEQSVIDINLCDELTTKLDYENGIVYVSLGEKIEGAEVKGSFALSRSSSVNNYSTWVQLYSFTLAGDYPTEPIYTDYTVEHGESYQYAIQLYNSSDVYSRRITSAPITANFEDAFLYDGTRQLRIRFNPKVTSFKTVVQENKKTTLGSKYPFVFRSGAVEYKEFPISGLISYMMDNNESFLKRVDDLRMPEGWANTMDIVDDNITYERRFKLAVLDWLNDGSVKLFRSPVEGNYFVRLTNISLTPTESVSRMIHTFNCTATEVAEFSDANLSTYGLVDAETVEEDKTVQLYTISFADLFAQLYEEQREEYEDDDDATIAELTVSAIMNYDLLQGGECYSIKIEDVPTSLPASDNLSFMIGSAEVMMGVTGRYEVTVTDPITIFSFANTTATHDFIKANLFNMQGQVTIAATINSDSELDKVVGATTYSVPLAMFFGSDEEVNIFDNYQDLKNKITNIYYARFSRTDYDGTEDGAYLFTWGNQEGLSVAEGNVIELVNPALPTLVEGGDCYCTLGPGVCAEVSIGLVETTNELETTDTELIEAKKIMDDAYLAWRAQNVGLKRSSTTNLTDDASEIYYIYELHTFRALEDYEYENYQDSTEIKVWTYYKENEEKTTALKEAYLAAHEAYMALLKKKKVFEQKE